MKKILLVLITFLLFDHLHAQISLNTTAHWNQSQFYNSFNLITESVKDIEGVSDTFISNKKYLKLKETVASNHSTRVDSMGIISWVKTQLPIQIKYSFIRLENNKFYYIDPNNNDQLLYDFNLVKGDDYSKGVFDFACSTVSGLTFEKTDIVCLGNTSLKSWQLSSRNYPSANYLIEGIGPNTGLFTPFCKNGCPECSYQLNYFTLNNDTLYKGNCDKSASIPETQKSTDYETYYDNNFFQLDFKTTGKFKIYSILGQYVLSETISNAGLINFENLSLKTGIYLVEIETNSGIQFIKIIQP